MLLDVRGLTLRFGGLTAVNDVSLSVGAGEIFSVIGPNGAGKTSLFNALTGIYRPSGGAIYLRGNDVRKSFSARVAARMLLSGLGTAIFAVLMCNVQSLWSAIITDNYVYQQPFAWEDAVRDGWVFLVNLPRSQGTFPFFLGAVIGALGALSVWSRSRYSPTIAARRGLSRTFQNIRLFPDMSVLQNVMVSQEKSRHCSVVESIFRFPRHYREERRCAESAREWLQFVGLENEEAVLASSLPYGHQRRLEIARALATDPCVLLLDEPAAGMNPAESASLMALIRRIKERGITVLLIEHHMQVVMGVSDRILVLDYGNKIAEGTPEEIKCNQRVIDAYLGCDGGHGASIA